MKGIIIYASKYGFTKRYAEWLAQETGFDCTETEKARIENIKQYDIIIAGGGIYASGISGLSFLKKNIRQLENRKIILFCTGASPYEEPVFQQVKEHNLKGELAGLPCFYCRGGLDMSLMGFADRSLCRMLQKAAGKKKPEECSGLEKALLEAAGHPCDWTDRSFLIPVLEALRTE